MQYVSLISRPASNKINTAVRRPGYEASKISAQSQSLYCAIRISAAYFGRWAQHCGCGCGWIRMWPSIAPRLRCANPTWFRTWHKRVNTVSGRCLAFSYLRIARWRMGKWKARFRERERYGIIYCSVLVLDTVYCWLELSSEGQGEAEDTKEVTEEASFTGWRDCKWLWSGGVSIYVLACSLASSIRKSILNNSYPVSLIHWL